jgi:hypothetical protein
MGWAGAPNQNSQRTVKMSVVTVAPAIINTIQARDQNVASPAGTFIGDAYMVFPAGALTAGVTIRASIVGTAGQFSFRGMNPTLGNITPASAAWVVVDLSELPMQLVTIAPALVGLQAAAMQNITVPGLRVGDCLLAIPPVALTNDVDVIAARVVTKDTLPLLFANPTAGNITPASATWRLINLRDLKPQLITIQPNGGVAIAASTAGNIDVTVPGVQVGDCIIAIPPQGLIAGVFPTVLRAVAANTLRMRIANPTLAGVTPASQVWALVNLGH